tara:strand:+ start:462 stop:2864 length:2403 start_codon:yes stop_codon:yes gene_type:complete
MKNRFINFLVLGLVLFFNYITPLLSEEVNFEATKIETVNENLITASGDVYIYDNKGNEIYSDNLSIDNKKKIYKISNNVIIKNTNNLVLIKANEVIYDQNKSTIISVGQTNIEKNKDFLINSSNIFYNLNSNEISSDEKTLLNDPDSNKIDVQNFNLNLKKNRFIAKNVQITDKELNIYNVKKIFYDLSKKRILGQDVSINEDNPISSKDYLPRAKSRSFVYENGDFILKKSIYTNCKKRDGCPPWSIAAKEVRHDKKNKLVKYDNATFRLYDVPIIYFPKFFHPDPTVKRQSGFLAPSFLTQNSANYLKTPYFFAISDSSDFTFSPRFYDNQNNIYQGEYRKVNKKSKHTFDASIKSEDGFLKQNSSQSHFFSKSTIKTNFDLFDFSKIDIQLQAVSNDDYLKFNDITSPIVTDKNTLNSKIEFEGSGDDIEFSFNTEIYEDLNEENESDKYEFIFPNFSLSKNLDTKLEGSLDVSSFGYNKLYDTNVNEKVLINNLSYKSQDKISKFGFVNNFQFLFKNFNADSKNSKSLKNKSENNLRGIFQFNSKFPLRKTTQKYTSMLTPIFVAKFNPQNNKNINNEERLVDYSNIYSIDRISSSEVLEGGESLTIGNEFKLFSNKNKDSEIFGLNLATSFRADENLDLPNSSFISQKTSNIVGESKIKLNDFMDLQYDFLSDNNLGDFHYHNINAKFKINNFVSTFEFIEEGNEIGNTHFFANETSLKIDENKNLMFRTRKNKKTDLTEYYNLIYQYKMDCLVAEFKYNKDYYSDGSLKPEESLFFSISIMPLGNSINLPGIDK